VEDGLGYLRLFGGLRLVLPCSTLVDGSLATKTTALLKLLGVRPGHSAHRDEIADVLWPNCSADHAYNNLYKALHELRAHRPIEAESDIVVLKRKVLTLADWIVVDVDEFTDAVRLARATRSTDSYERALQLAVGKLLSCDLYEDWAEPPRRYIDDILRQVRAELAELLVERGEAARAEGVLLHYSARDLDDGMAIDASAR
jgi:DNA-binding SARP family transcriptional activator